MKKIVILAVAALLALAFAAPVFADEVGEVPIEDHPEVATETPEVETETPEVASETPSETASETPSETASETASEEPASSDTSSTVAPADNTLGIVIGIVGAVAVAGVVAVAFIIAKKNS